MLSGVDTRNLPGGIKRHMEETFQIPLQIARLLEAQPQALRDEKRISPILRLFARGAIDQVFLHADFERPPAQFEDLLQRLIRRVKRRRQAEGNGSFEAPGTVDRDIVCAAANHQMKIPEPAPTE